MYIFKVSIISRERQPKLPQPAFSGTLQICSPLRTSLHLFAFLLLKQLGKLQFAAAEGWVKVKLYNLSFKLYVVL